MNESVEQTIRHGFEEQYRSDTLPGDYQESDGEKAENVCYMYYTEKRHENNANVNPDHPAHGIIEHDWRMREKIKTVSCALVMCLNIGVDPPDVVKTNPCAKLEVWIDPFSLPTQKALEAIGKNLQTQYETLQPRARYKLSLDPCIEEIKKLCCSLRKSAKEERVLFHYNGHGVPKPTTSGEIWVFNKNYTQYIPLTLYDLQSWLGSPCMYVYDCSSAGNILLSFNRFAKQRDSEAAKLGHAPYTPMSDCIQLAACGPNDILPMNPDLPADLFTCCLTTPIQIALQWFAIQNPLLTSVTTEMILKIPGKLSDRRTPLGELNWIFTAITDTIAWSVLPHDLFKKYFRQDMMVAAMLRNFLLADRIMRSYNCTPMSMPPLPSTHQHPLWKSWDFAVDICLAQLPGLLAMEEGGPPVEYVPSTLFNEQLTAFEIWLSHGSINRNPPEQLPILLQVLLSQGHRLRALILLCKFLDLGPWAVDLALAVGIFPYVLKLLQSPAADLKPLLVFIWARILAVDSSCQNDLLKDDGYTYFANVLAIDTDISPIPNISEHRAMCTFILSVLCNDFRLGKEACLRSNVLSLCLSHLSDEDPLLRQWACLCIGQQWAEFADAKWLGVRENAHEKLCTLLSDPVPEVRSAAMYALGLFIGDLDKTEQIVNIEHNIAITMLIGTSDGSPMVRRELVIALSKVVHEYMNKFLQVAYELVEEDRKQSTQVTDDPASQRGRTERKAIPEQMFRSVNHNSVYTCVWKALINLSADPHNDVSMYAIKVVDYVHYQLINSSMSEEAASSLLHLPPPGASVSGYRNGSATPNSLSNSSVNGAHPGGNQRLTSRITSTLRRSASFSLKALGYMAGGANDSDTNINVPKPAQESQSKRSSFMSRAESFTHLNEMVSDNESHVSIPRIEPYEKIDLPLKSDFYNWCREYFSEPQMRPAEADEPGSVNYNERLWRRMRNEKVIYESHPLSEHAGTSKWESPIGTMHIDSPPISLLFHQFESHLVVSDNKGEIGVWDWEAKQRINYFANGLSSRPVTSIKFINEEDSALLVTGSNDGIVSIYRNYDSHEMQTVSSWRALPEMLPSNRGSGVILDWQQSRGSLLASGDIKSIKVWDAARETCVVELPSRSGSCVTSLTSEKISGDIVVGGFGDGTVRVYDRRIEPRDSMVMCWREHPGWVVNVHMQHGGNRELVSGSVAGDIKLWDIRHPASIYTIEAHTQELTALAVHEHAPVFASGSSNQSLKVWNAGGTNLSTIRHYTGILSQRIVPISSVAFHPHRTILAVGGEDQYISLFKCDLEGLVMNAFDNYHL
ncbi:hypothetical protein K493DRAFT_237024 [Basidiobolus meristosporus CBS 931.73]|uniref:Raptor N-terminal CASPase-like domain-containing protein n=1 Tax=Basidiobolus meristosporus CBS 931.73 TaxID=1314790 RepID=A0A1Y1XQQ2_9FUNG|nr:hypothetical protein K493DRAFT_237024 [Basidiobolus meristosporus CBS 931.73]|eukprot:ORX88057.1 hypothetical protein K493DRAFT_237024 [Basidiobolus meristosporus CBS 931.73]